MPGYLVRHAKGQQGDVLIEDPTLRVTFVRGWVVFTEGETRHDKTVVLAMPAEQVASVQRVGDTPQETTEE